MTPRREQRTEPGGRAEAVIRLAQARKFREVAEQAPRRRGRLV